MQAKDIMTRDVATVQPDTSIREAAILAGRAAPRLVRTEIEPRNRDCRRRHPSLRAAVSE